MATCGFSYFSIARKTEQVGRLERFYVGKTVAGGDSRSIAQGALDECRNLTVTSRFRDPESWNSKCPFCSTDFANGIFGLERVSKLFRLLPKLLVLKSVSRFYGYLAVERKICILKSLNFPQWKKALPEIVRKMNPSQQAYILFILFLFVKCTWIYWLLCYLK